MITILFFGFIVAISSNLHFNTVFRKYKYKAITSQAAMPVTLQKLWKLQKHDLCLLHCIQGEIFSLIFAF